MEALCAKRVKIWYCGWYTKVLAHLGIDATLESVKEYFYFTKMRDFVTKYVNSCINCLYAKPISGKKPGFLHPLSKGDTPFYSVHIDHVGPSQLT